MPRSSTCGQMVHVHTPTAYGAWSNCLQHFCSGSRHVGFKNEIRSSAADSCRNLRSYGSKRMHAQQGLILLPKS